MGGAGSCGGKASPHIWHSPALASAGESHEEHCLKARRGGCACGGETAGRGSPHIWHSLLWKSAVDWHAGQLRNAARAGVVELKGGCGEGREEASEL
eukprot:CAMPEP_0174942340 /NCGR_PEP_ID=MMETSP1355-20121228/74072_1 /TAXON_ID=464990 /ORGANISM="Hemiselmis tepida, Strain CCMP443" /LENGTH=96 /DNA_ID=CAMNT_0016189503 /DNA_START=86 /DNA_END=376 /DNA_ORIENTATION=+